MASDVEGGKQAIREDVATRDFVTRKPSVVVEHTQAMHDAIKSFFRKTFPPIFALVRWTWKAFTNCVAIPMLNGIIPKVAPLRSGPPRIPLVSGPFSPLCLGCERKYLNLFSVL